MDLLDEAISFAVKKHSGQVRKMEESPYILHPVEVMSVVGTMTADKEILAAAVLHDTVEDTDTTIEEIRENFGTRVSLLVMTETENKREDLPPGDTWQLRKEETLMMLENTNDMGVRMMWLGDKLSNMRSFARSYRKYGDAMWENFNQKNPEKQAWYYGKIIEFLKPLKEYDAYREFVSLVNYVFKDHIGGLNDEQ